MRSLMPLVLSLIFFASGCVSSIEKSHSNNRLTVLFNDAAVHAAYTNGKSILLFAYNDENKGTEAYADWAAYLNDFKASNSEEFFIKRVSTKILNRLVANSASMVNFSLFIKKGKPSFLYKDLILEPQVYVAVNHVFENAVLTPEDNAFLPDEVCLKLK